MTADEGEGCDFLKESGHPSDSWHFITGLT